MRLPMRCVVWILGKWFSNVFGSMWQVEFTKMQTLRWGLEYRTFIRKCPSEPHQTKEKNQDWAKGEVELYNGPSTSLGWPHRKLWAKVIHPKLSQTEPKWSGFPALSFLSHWMQSAPDLGWDSCLQLSTFLKELRAKDCSDSYLSSQASGLSLEEGYGYVSLSILTHAKHVLYHEAKSPALRISFFNMDFNHGGLN